MLAANVIVSLRCIFPLRTFLIPRFNRGMTTTDAIIPISSAKQTERQQLLDKLLYLVAEEHRRWMASDDGWDACERYAQTATKRDKVQAAAKSYEGNPIDFLRNAAIPEGLAPADLLAPPPSEFPKRKLRVLIELMEKKAENPDSISDSELQSMQRKLRLLFSRDPGRRREDVYQAAFALNCYARGREAPAEAREALTRLIEKGLVSEQAVEQFQKKSFRRSNPNSNSGSVLHAICLVLSPEYSKLSKALNSKATPAQRAGLEARQKHIRDQFAKGLKRASIPHTVTCDPALE